MEKVSKLILIILAISILLLAITVPLIIFNKNSEEQILFKFSYENNSWKSKKYGYNIYFNGTIESYDKYDESKNKSAQITNEELEQLKKYADAIDDKYKSNNDRNYDAGKSIYQVYNSELAKWIIVKKGGVVTGVNESKLSEKLVDFVDELYNKYLK